MRKRDRESRKERQGNCCIAMLVGNSRHTFGPLINKLIAGTVHKHTQTYLAYRVRLSDKAQTVCN